MVSVVMRDANPGDLDALKGTFRCASVSNEGDRANLLAEPEVLEYSDEWVRRGCTRVAISDGRIVGFVTAVPHDPGVELEDLFVDPEWMRRGVGLSLVGDVATRARQHGVGRIDLVPFERRQ